MSTFARYLLFQAGQWLILALLLAYLVERSVVPAWAAAAIFLFWLAKDLAFYPIVRQSYEKDPRIGGERLIGNKGVAREQLDPRGYIRIQGELWKAQASCPDRPIPKHSIVKVTGARGLTLIVEAEPSVWKSIPGQRGDRDKEAHRESRSR